MQARAQNRRDNGMTGDSDPNDHAGPPSQVHERGFDGALKARSTLAFEPVHQG
ncbi:MAG: hypothetical protein ACPHID_08600 [Thermoplasmatota archaeon]